MVLRRRLATHVKVVLLVGSMSTALPFAEPARACEALLGTSYTDPPEIAQIELDDREWHVAYRARTPDYALREHVLGGETIQTARELVTWQVSFGSRSGDLAEHKDRLLDALRRACATFEQRGHPAPVDELRFEWWHAGCGDQNPRHEIVRLLRGAIGIHTLAYSRRGALIPDTERKTWQQRLVDSTLALKTQPHVSTELRAGRLALWRGDYAEAQRRLRPLADAGDTDAIVALAGLYAEGWGVQRDYASARDALQRAAEQGNADAALGLGRMYEKGWGVPEDTSTARSWYLQAAKQGLAEAQARAGYLLILGESNRFDAVEANHWFRLGAAQGNSEALYWLAFAHEHAWSVERDRAQAVQLYREAAVQGDGPSQFRIGLAYEYGRGVERDRDAARIWYERAALQGEEQARFALRDRFSPEIATPPTGIAKAPTTAADASGP